MSCFHTIKAWQTEKGAMLTFNRPKYITAQCKEYEIPCGKCIGCRRPFGAKNRLDHANEWATRAFMEAKTWKNNCFITLTYNNENLPEDKLLHKKDLQDFMKRLRYYYEGDEEWVNPVSNKKEKPIRFIACGEYGKSENSTYRPHFHILIFNWKPKDKLKFYKENINGDRLLISKEITRIWGKGFTTVGELNYKTACYVSRYCTKKLYQKGKTNREIYKKLELEPEFILMSRNGGIGIKYWEQYEKLLLKQEGILVKIKDKVKSKPIPKYFMNKFKQKNELNYEKYQNHKRIKAIKNMKEILSKTTLTESEYKQMLENQLKKRTLSLKRENLI